ncbi:putative hydrolase of alpha/beta superfamily [Bernardetia litoralis DSM 6794]|uniref:Putative hydrolase of alpha/beta superfamily n=1 Tax=Bernardetia litoralis (strain ATCC 23117 / DSM 6794 / NBRC 15988 / NCIMB 1366 / Fx l1 / Sio-4) TaxID=880071 RepID=I4AH29_BERLS|nr:alpha/beta hydrolase-fold protein [Bernardetia litoralis]AFM03264.1 putative hydrolase of alpha/beta superfamily [Bernardetia litoralis DSM 6794]
MKKHILSFVFILFSQFIIFQSIAQEKQVFPFGVIEEIDSKELEEKRTLNIYLPQGYHLDSANVYPVIYVLDGSQYEDFPHIAGLVQFMNMYEILPKSIVVGISNLGKSRYKDFTYPSDDKQDLKDISDNGGSEKFIGYLENEVIPLMEKSYKISSHRTIIGQSLGGLLATEILFKKPYLFDDYVIVSPSLWWDNQKMVKKADNFLENLSKNTTELKKENPNYERKIFVSLGKEHPVMHKVADKLVDSIKKLEETKNGIITLFYEPILKENHATILHLAVYKAFENFYKKGKKKK